MAMFFCSKCYPHLSDLLKHVVGDINCQSHFLNVQKQFVDVMIWNKRNRYFLPSFSKSFIDKLDSYKINSIRKWKADKNACFYHHCVLFKGNGKRLVSFTRSGVHCDSMKFYEIRDNLEKYLVKSSEHYPSPSNFNVDLTSDLHNCSAGALHFNDVLIDDCQC